jgi:hypothetical protein
MTEVYMITRRGLGSAVLWWTWFPTEDEARRFAITLGYQPRNFVVVAIAQQNPGREEVSARSEMGAGHRAPAENR